MHPAAECGRCSRPHLRRCCDWSQHWCWSHSGTELGWSDSESGYETEIENEIPRGQEDRHRCCRNLTGACREQLALVLRCKCSEK